MPRPELATGDRLVLKVGTTSLVAPDGEPDEERLRAPDRCDRRSSCRGHPGDPRLVGSDRSRPHSARVHEPARATSRRSRQPRRWDRGGCSGSTTRCSPTHGLTGAQLLLTRYDFMHRQQYLNARNTLDKLAGARRRPDRQRERHDRGRRDPFRRQRPARGARREPGSREGAAPPHRCEGRAFGRPAQGARRSGHRRDRPDHAGDREDRPAAAARDLASGGHGLEARRGMGGDLLRSRSRRGRRSGSRRPEEGHRRQDASGPTSCRIRRVRRPAGCGSRSDSLRRERSSSTPARERRSSWTSAACWRSGVVAVKGRFESGDTVDVAEPDGGGLREGVGTLRVTRAGGRPRSFDRRARRR